MLCLIFAALRMSIAAAQTVPVAPQDDTQNWNEQVVSVSLDERINLLVTGQLRIGDRLRDFTDSTLR